MKIYTKTGDKGETSLLSGNRVPKYHLRLESYGTVDELNAHIALIKDNENSQEIKDNLLQIQKKLFSIGSTLALDENNYNISIPEISNTDIKWLEEEIDRMSSNLPEMKNFILPGGHPLVSQCHVARCVCRRAERRCVELSEAAGVSLFVIKFLNRLSDYLFMLARYLGHRKGVSEIPWNSGE